MSLNEFRQFCNGVWDAAPHYFVTIDLTSGKLDGKYRENLDRFYLPGIHSISPPSSASI